MIGEFIVIFSVLSFFLIIWILSDLSYKKVGNCNRCGRTRIKESDLIKHPESELERVCIYCIEEVRDEIMRNEKSENDLLKENLIGKKDSGIENEEINKEVVVKELAQAIQSKINKPEIIVRDSLTIIERAEVAKTATSKFDYQKIEDIRDFLVDENNLLESVKVLHESLKSVYEEEIKKKGVIREYVSEEIWSNEIACCMEMGEKYLLGSQGFLQIRDNVEPEIEESRTIRKQHSWKELKDREGLS